MSNFRKFISMSAVAILGVTNMLTPLSYAQEAAKPYDSLTNDDLENHALRFVMPNRDVFLYAMTEANKYFVKYNGNTHTSGEMGTGTFTYDTTGHLETNKFAKTGYTFTGWNTQAGGGGTGYEDGAAVWNWTAVESGLVNIYAQWKANGYRIIYDLNDDDGGTSQGVHSKTPSELNYNQTGTIVNPSRTGYGFSGWTITNMDSEAHIVGGQASNATSATGVKGTEFKNLRATSGDVNFKAIWSKNLHTPYTVKHYLENLTGGYPTEPVKTDDLSGTTDTTVTPSVHVYTGFTPDANTPTSGNIDADGNKVFTYRYTRDSKDLTITAGRGVASVKGVGTVNTTGATTTSSTSISFKYDEPVTLSFTLESGYTGGTWSGYLDDDATFNMPAFSTGKTAYATPITYTITYNPRSGIVSPANPTSYTVESSGITLNNPDRIHSKFAGWTGGVIGGTQLAGPTMTVTIPTGSTGNRSYTATWTCLSGYHLNDAQTECIPDEDTEYKVKHYFQQLTGGENYDLIDTTTQTGRTESMTDAHTIAHTGFTVRTPIDNQPITGDGSTAISIRYLRNSYTGTIASVTGITGAKADGKYADGPYKYDDEVTLSADTLPGYTFDHWEVEDASGHTVPVTNSGNEDGATFNMPASSVTITPKVTRNDYTITMILHNGTGTYPSEYTVESADIPLPNPTRDTGSVFEGWSGTDITSAPQKPVTIAHGSVGNRTYEAIWSCRAGYHEVGDSCVANEYQGKVDFNDGTGHGAAETVEFTYDQVTSLPNPEQSGYIFSGWKITGMSGGVEHIIGTVPVTGDTVDITKATEFKNLSVEQGMTNIKFTAIWTARDDTEYVVYHYVKNVGAKTYTLSGTDNLTGTTDSTLTLAALKKTFTGFTYSGGYLTGSTTRPTSGAVTTTTIDKYGRTAIYLYYDRNMLNVYLSGDAHIATLSGAGQYEYGATVNVDATVKTGYHFKQWKKKANSGFVTDL